MVRGWGGGGGGQKGRGEVSLVALREVRVCSRLPQRGCLKEGCLRVQGEEDITGNMEVPGRSSRLE